MTRRTLTTPRSLRAGGSGHPDSLGAENGGHGLEGGRLPVHHERAPHLSAQPAHPTAQLGPVGVRGVAADRLDLGVPLVLLAQDLHDVLAVLDPASERSLRLKADEQNQVAVLPDPVGEVVKDAPPSSIPDAATITAGPCSVFRAFESATSRM